MSELYVLALMSVLLFVTWLGLWGEDPSRCPMRCFNHQNRSRFHVPCSRCADRHEVTR